MPFDLIEPALNSVYLFLAIVGALSTFVGWLYTRQQNKREEDKKEFFAYVDDKFSHVETKQDNAINLLKQLVNYETRNIKLHIRNLTATDQRLEEDICRIETVVFFGKNEEINRGKNKKSNKSTRDNQNMEDDNIGY